MLHFTFPKWNPAIKTAGLLFIAFYKLAWLIQPQYAMFCRVTRTLTLSSLVHIPPHTHHAISVQVWNVIIYFHHSSFLSTTMIEFCTAIYFCQAPAEQINMWKLVIWTGMFNWTGQCSVYLHVRYHCMHRCLDGTDVVAEENTIISYHIAQSRPIIDAKSRYQYSFWL